MGVVCTIVPSPFKLTWVALLPICIAEASHRYWRLYFANALEPPSIPPSITLTYKWPASPTSLPTTPPSAPNNPLFSVTGETIYDPRQRWMCGGIKREIATPTSDVSLGSLHWAFQVEISTYMPTNKEQIISTFSFHSLIGSFLFLLLLLPGSVCLLVWWPAHAVPG